MHNQSDAWNPGDVRDVLRAALDRLIPADDFPGALAAGAERSLARHLAGDAGPKASLITDGLQALNDEARHRCGIPFAALDSARQDELLTAVERGSVRTEWPVSSAAFFTSLLELANECYYGGPDGAGQAEPVSWRMIGYRPGPRITREQE